MFSFGRKLLPQNPSCYINLGSKNIFVVLSERPLKDCESIHQILRGVRHPNGPLVVYKRREKNLAWPSRSQLLTKLSDMKHNKQKPEQSDLHNMSIRQKKYISNSYIIGIASIFFSVGLLKKLELSSISDHIPDIIRGKFLVNLSYLTLR